MELDCKMMFWLLISLNNIRKAINEDHSNEAKSDKYTNDVKYAYCVKPTIDSERDFFRELSHLEVAIQNTNLVLEFYEQKLLNDLKKKLNDSKADSCAEIMKCHSSDGIYELELPNLNVFNVYCKDDRAKDDRGSWTVIARRFDGTVSFNENMKSYAKGFGSLNGEFFIGLDKLHAMTNARLHTLWVHLVDIHQDEFHGFYDAFVISDGKDAYRVVTLGFYSGTAGNGLEKINNQKFTAEGSDNDKNSTHNCGAETKSGWWFGSTCVPNLFGKYDATKGVTWSKAKNSIIQFDISIRPIS